MLIKSRYLNRLFYEKYIIIAIIKKIWQKEKLKKECAAFV